MGWTRLRSVSWAWPGPKPNGLVTMYKHSNQPPYQLQNVKGLQDGNKRGSRRLPGVASRRCCWQRRCCCHGGGIAAADGASPFYSSPSSVFFLLCFFSFPFLLLFSTLSSVFSSLLFCSPPLLSPFSFVLSFVFIGKTRKREAGKATV